MGDVAQVVAIEGHAAGARVVEARDEREEGRFARARGARDGDAAPRAGPETQPMQDRVVLAVLEGDVLESDLAEEAPGLRFLTLEQGLRHIQHRFFLR